jgi:short-subunit dehydrogenase
MKPNNMTNPTKKLAVITGPTSGIGRAFTIKLARQGYDLILIARREKKLQELSELLQREYHADTQYHIADLSKEADIKRIEKLIRQQKSINLLINNAGFGVAGFFMEVPMNEQLRMINVHLSSTIRFSRAALPSMIQQESGSIINLASFAAFMELPGSVMYSTTKAAIIKFSQTLQNEVAPYGVKIQALCPGFTPTAFHSSIKRDAEFINRVPDFLWTSTEKVVNTSIMNLNSRRVICIPGAFNNILFWLNKPQFISKWIQFIANKRQKKQSRPEVLEQILKEV